MKNPLLNARYLERFFPKDEDGYEMVNLAFYFGFWFPDGLLAEKRRRAAEVCDDYWKLCGHELKWMIKPIKCTWQKVPKDYTMQKWLAAYPKEDWVWEMIFHSGAVNTEAAQYQILGLGNGTRTHGYSYVYLFVPAYFFVENQTQHPIVLYRRWAQMLQARHGTAGLGLVPPEDTPKRAQSSALVRAFATQFPGLEIANPLGSQNVTLGLLSANWLNMIDDDCIAELGGIDEIKARLEKDPLGKAVGFHPYQGGLILSSGEHPEICQDNQPGSPPRAYGPVARLLKPLRTKEPWGTWGIPAEESLDWLARFDRA